MKENSKARGVLGALSRIGEKSSNGRQRLYSFLAVGLIFACLISYVLLDDSDDSDEWQYKEYSRKDKRRAADERAAAAANAAAATEALGPDVPVGARAQAKSADTFAVSALEAAPNTIDGPSLSLADFTGPEDVWPAAPVGLDKPMPEPLRVMEQYKRWHSVQAVREDPDGRRFAMGVYACPHSAGNRMHTFSNHLLWAVLTNRTLLWKYLDDETCNAMLSQRWDMRQEHCETANTAADCAESLHRYDWLPSAEEWSAKLHLGQPVYLPNHVRGEDVLDTARIPHQAGSQKEHYVVFPNHVYPLDTDTLLASVTDASPWTKQAAAALMNMGQDFLYGMLHRYVFDFSESVKESVQVPIAGRNAITIAIQSRHPIPTHDGCDINLDVKYLEPVLYAKYKRGKSCLIVVASDRTCAVNKLSSWVEDIGCHAVTVRDRRRGSGNFPEHGPFAGFGYFQDLYLASEVTRDAVIGSAVRRRPDYMRSSSRLFVELVDFNRRMEALLSGSGSTVAKLTQSVRPTPPCEDRACLDRELERLGK